MKGHFLPFEKLTALQQAQVRAVVATRKCGAIEDGRLREFEFWIKPDGNVSRRLGHHRMTEAAYREHLRRYGEPDRRKPDEPHAFGSGTTFHFSRD